MIDTTLVVLAVVPHEGRYLVVEERDGTFYLPAGRVEHAESLVAAAVRETAEESGIVIRPIGILGIDHSWEPRAGAARARLRFVFVGAPTTLAPKSRPDHHSRGAHWLSKREIEARPLRHPEVLEWIARAETATSLLPCAAYEWMGPAS